MRTNSRYPSPVTFTFQRKSKVLGRFRPGSRGRYYISACDFGEQGTFEMACRLASYPMARVQAVNSPTPARDQYHDRMLYWNLRWLSRRRDRGVLTIIIDSMDKAKMAWPQWAFRKPKAFDHCHRPKLVLTGAMAHGWCTDFYLSHDGIVSHGCSMFCEILEQTIARVAAICAREGLELPSHLCVQSDNTTSQSKNSQACEFLAGDRSQRLTHDARHGVMRPHPL